MEELPRNWTDSISGKKVVVSTPMHDGRCHGKYLNSMLGLWRLLEDIGVECQLDSLANNSIIQTARNIMVNSFLEETDAEYIMFIDSDMGFDPAYVPLMMYYNKDITTAPSPKKEINWKIVKKAIKELDSPEAHLPYYAGSYIVGLENDSKFNPLEMVKVKRAGLGFTLVKRKVLEELRENGSKEDWFKTQPVCTSRQDGKIYAFFNVVQQGELIGEDNYFVINALAAGFEAWMCPWMEMMHCGSYNYVGDLKVVAALGETG